MIFQPNHEGSTWEELQWADCRDPMVAKDGDIYYLYYSAYDEQGGIIGVATSNSLNGEWVDLGSTIPPIAGTIPESATLFNQDSFFYLFYHISGQAETYRIGATPTGPWMDAEVIGPGWAHEVWMGIDGLRYTSYLTVYSISISPLTWIPDSYPPRPFIGDEYYRTLIPIAIR
jgi:beta-xylosidase